MKNKSKFVIVLSVALLIASLAAGCGGSSDSGETEGNASFLRKGSKNKIAKFGQEADADEREAASKVLEENLQARAAGDWAAQCASLSATAIKNNEASAALEGVQGSCAKNLESQAQPLSETKAIRTNTMTGPIAALRVKGNKAFALYHGAKGMDYAMSMEKEGDEWKVASLATQEIP
jgi:hypothetical protein